MRVGKDEIEGLPSGQIEQHLGLLAGASGEDMETFGGQRLLQQFAQHRFILQDEQMDGGMHEPSRDLIDLCQRHTVLTLADGDLRPPAGPNIQPQVVLCNRIHNLFDVGAGGGLIYRKAVAEKDGKHLGAKIRRLREQMGLSQSELGERLGVSYQQIQKYERGINRFSVEALVKLAKALDQSVAALLDGTGENARGHVVAEPRAEYPSLSKDEKEFLKCYREIGDEKARAALLALLKAMRQRA